MPTSFGQLGLSSASLAALAKQGYAHPTPIQARAIPIALTGRDLIGCAATGTGKTAAFVLPMIERLGGRPGTLALVLAPTRELILQTAAYLHDFGGGKVTSTTVMGGVGMGAQRHALALHPTVVLATPGRLVDLLQQRAADLSKVEVLVLDEADRMLDMGFKPQLDRILAHVPKRRQTMLFSATMGVEVQDFARRTMQDPARVEVAQSGTTAARADQRVFLVPQAEKIALLLTLIAEGDDSTLVFTRTKRRADRIARSLERAGHATARIHADRSQPQRVQALEGFRSGKYRVLVATDIAARGLDVENIGHVILVDLPHVSADYVHRVGRTARAAASGRASSFASTEELPLLREIEKLLKKPIPRATLPSDSPIYKAEMARRPEEPPARSQGRDRRKNGGRPAGRPGGGARNGSPSEGSHPGASSSHEPSSAPTGKKPARVASYRPRRRR
jgi:ATP-dependent RNA helicase RhlE